MVFNSPHRRGLYALTVVWAVALIGCQQDTRLTLHEFMAIEEGVTLDPDSDPTTQPAEPELVPWGPTPYLLGPGDVLNVNVAGLEALGLPGAYTIRINDQGQAVLPTVGAIVLSDLTPTEAEEKIRAAYSPQYITDTEVSIDIVDYGTIDVIVMGAVRMPATVEIRRDTASILRAVLAAGGPTEVAHGQVTLIPARAPDSPVELDLEKRADLVRAAQTGVIQSSDIVMVGRRHNELVYVQGLVNMPGPVPVPQGTHISVLQAIGAAGGTLREFAPREATLMRRQENGEHIRVQLDLAGMLAGLDPDIALAPGDILTIPHTPTTRLEEFLARTFVLRWGLDTTFNPWTYYYMKKDREIRAGLGDSGFYSTFGRQLSTMDLTPLYPTPAPGVP